MLEWALKYFRMGFSVIPLVYGTKRPAISWKRYQSERPSVEDIMAWFEQPANIGIVTGRVSGIIVYDFDSPDVFARYSFPHQSVVRTSRGYHVYCKYRDGIKSRVVEGIEVKSDGSYVVAPPSLHPDGTVYSLLGDSIVPLAHVIDLTGRIYTGDLSQLYGGVAEGRRNQSLAKIAGSLLADGVSLEDCLDFALEWNRKNHPPMEDSEVIGTVKSIYRRKNAEKNRGVYVKLASSFLRYSPFSVQKNRENNFLVEHKFRDFTVTVRADETINQQDNDVFKAVLKLMQIANRRNGITVNTISVLGNDYQVAGTVFRLRDIMVLAKTKWSFVKESLLRLGTLRILFKSLNSNGKEHTVLVTPFPRIVIDERTNRVSVFFDWELFRRSISRETALTQNLSLFTSLNSNVAKSLFDYLTVNSSRDDFRESTIIERLGLTDMEKRFARRKILRALEELKQKSIIADFELVAGSKNRSENVLRVSRGSAYK